MLPPASYLLPSGLPLEPGPQSGGSRGRKRAEVCGRLRNPRRAPSSTFPPWGMETAREGSPALPAHPRSLQLLTHTPVEEVSRRGGDASQAKGIFLDGLLTLTCRQFREWWWLHAVTSHYKTSSFTERLSDACFPRNPKANTTFLTSSTPFPKRTGATHCFQVDWEGDASISQHHVHLHSFLHATSCFTPSSNPSRFRHGPNQTQPEVRFTLQHPTLC